MEVIEIKLAKKDDTILEILDALFDYAEMGGDSMDCSQFEEDYGCHPNTAIAFIKDRMQWI